MKKNLSKQLTLLDVFCVATGAMISSGLFILPGLAFSHVGPGVVLSYLIAGIFCIPTVLSMAELSTAMPKAGGDYFYIMRGFGPFLGTIAGMSTWLSLILKSAFALFGIGAYLSPLTGLPLPVIGLAFCLFFTFLNWIGAKEAGNTQVFFVAGLLILLLIYLFMGHRFIQPDRFIPLLPHGAGALFSTAAFVFVSYGGLVKVVALAEEVHDPGKNLPWGMFLALIFTMIIYAAVIIVTIGLLDPGPLGRSLTPISDGAIVFGGRPLGLLLGFGAFLAFVTTANAGILTASRYPFGMSRDKLLPPLFQAIHPRFKTPHISIFFTGLSIAFAVIFLKLDYLVKVASTVLILLYLFANLTLILFRESGIQSYRPKFRSPFYPYVQVAGILACAFLLIEMGSFVIFFTSIFIFLGALWYKFYARQHASSDYALIYCLERLVSKDKEFSSPSLLSELKEIVIRRDGVVPDQFHGLVEAGRVLDFDQPLTMERFFQKVAEVLEKGLSADKKQIAEKFIAREMEASTVIRPGLAIPHIVVSGEDLFRIVLARSAAGIIFPKDEIVHAAFVLIATADQRSLHLKVLAAIAQIAQSPDFDSRWLAARSAEDLKNVVLLAKRRRELNDDTGK